LHSCDVALLDDILFNLSLSSHLAPLEIITRLARAPGPQQLEFLTGFTEMKKAMEYAFHGLFHAETKKPWGTSISPMASLPI
jgi:hypothetical protein